MFKKIRWFFFYRKIIHDNKELLFRKHGIKIDWVNRLYKTYILTEDDLNDIKSYGTNIIDRLLEKDQSKIEETLIDLKIHQFVGLMEIEPLNKEQIGIAFRFKHFNTARIANISIWLLISILSVSLSYLLNPDIKSILIGLIIVLIIYLFSRLFVVDRRTTI